MCYLPTTLVVLALMIRLHDRTDRQLRIQAGLAGYIAALVAVPVVSAMLDFRLHCCPGGHACGGCNARFKADAPSATVLCAALC